jgi:hypothetical protein
MPIAKLTLHSPLLSAAALAECRRRRHERADRKRVERSLAAVAHQYFNLADEAAKKKRSFVEYLEGVLQDEAALRDQRRRKYCKGWLASRRSKPRSEVHRRCRCADDQQERRLRS